MVPSLTRRQVLGALGAAVGGSAVVAGVADQISMDPIGTWEPAPVTWPCGRYDPGQTAANPHANPPTDPEIVWRTPTPGVSYDSGFVVGPERVYASGDRLTALSRRDGTIQWQRDRPPGPLVMRGGTLYHGAAPLLAVDAETGQPHWRSKGPHSAERFDAFTVTTETVLAAGGAYDIHDGSHKWSVDQTQFVAQNGSLYGYTESDALVTKYQSRSVLDVALGTGPTKVWQREHGSQWEWTVVQDDLLLRMQDLGGKVAGPGMRAFDTESGERAWTTLSPSDLESVANVSIDDPDNYGVQVRSSAFTKDRGFMWTTIERVWGGDAFSTVVAVSLADGTILWQRSLGQSEEFLHDIAVANGTVIVAHEATEPREKSETGGVLARAAATGREQWRVSTEYDPVQLAVADGTIFAVCDTYTNQVPNRVIALR